LVVVLLLGMGTALLWLLCWRSVCAGAQGARRAAVVITEEERRRNRMTSNRLSARKSRMKRQQPAEAERLRCENEATWSWR
jgi:hypothetical protein